MWIYQKEFVYTVVGPGSASASVSAGREQAEPFGSLWAQGGLKSSLKSPSI